MSIDVGWVVPIIAVTMVLGATFLLVLGYALAKAAGDADDRAGRPRG